MEMERIACICIIYAYICMEWNGMAKGHYKLVTSKKRFTGSTQDLFSSHNVFPFVALVRRSTAPIA